MEISKHGTCLQGLRETINTVACRPVAGQWSQNNAHWKGGRFLISGVMQPVSGLHLSKHIHTAMDMNTMTEEKCFICEPCREVITTTVAAMSLS
jgi:hypothetical protein